MRGRDSEKRSIIIAHLNRLHVQDLLAEKDLPAARGVIDKISEPEELAEAVASFANVARKKKADPQLVRELIDQARKSLGNNSGSAAHARAYLRLASSYSALDTQFGFELMSSAVKAANGAKDLLDLRPQSRIVHLGGASREGITAGEINGDFRPGFRSHLLRLVPYMHGLGPALLWTLCTVAVASFSWTFFESPINCLKRYFPYSGGTATGRTKAPVLSPTRDVAI